MGKKAEGKQAEGPDAEVKDVDVEALIESAPNELVREAFREVYTYCKASRREQNQL